MELEVDLGLEVVDLLLLLLEELGGEFGLEVLLYIKKNIYQSFVELLFPGGSAPRYPPPRGAAPWIPAYSSLYDFGANVMVSTHEKQKKKKKGGRGHVVQNNFGKNSNFGL